MDIEAMKAELRELNAQAEALDKKRRELRQQIADAQAKFKAGDRVTYDGAKYVWQITGIGVGYSNEPKYFGAKLKKDGTPGVMTGEIWMPYKAVLRAA
jgi:hypothetical protein